MPNINNIVKQLKSRKVFRSLAIYAAFAFVLIQVCSIVFPALYLPDWTMTFVVVLVIIGFPTTLVLSWIYDITPAEDEESAPIDTSQPLGVYALTGLVLTVIGIGFWVAVGVFGVTFGGNEEVPSIAIIPFDNKGADEDEFYAYSISSELISDVAGAGLIRVASKKQIEDVRDLPMDELAEKLLVRYVVTGDLWKIDSVFQLSMELYDTKTSKVLWSESWQRAWNELASIKGSLAENILKTLKVSTNQDIAKATTSNTEAYEFYLRAKYIHDKRENLKDTEVARGLLRKAIELDDNLLIAKNVLAVTYYKTGDFDKAMEIYLENLKQAEKIGDKDIQARSLNNIGILCEENADHDKALDYYDRSLKIVEELGDKKGISSTLNNIAVVHHDKGDLDKALDYYGRSLAINEDIGDKRGIGYSLQNIGILYYSKGDKDKALDYFDRSLAIAEELGNKSGIGEVLHNIGLVHSDKGNYDTALDYYKRSLAIVEEIGDKYRMGYSLQNIGILYYSKGDKDKALDYFDRSLAIAEELGNKSGMGEYLLMIGWIYYEMGGYNKALDYYNRELKILEELDDKHSISNNFSNMGLVYFQQEDYNKAVEYLDKSATMQMELDSTITLETLSHMFLSKKILGKEYNLTEIHNLIKDQEEIADYINFALFKLLDDPSYLETAYNQVQELADNLEPDVAAKFLSYPIPAAIVEEWEKVK